jgi:hypothetical protein
MKKLLISLLSLIIIFTCVGCSTPNTNGNNTNNGGINYSTNQGTKIENLATNKQQTIDKYVNDCKILYTLAYKEVRNNMNTVQPLPYISFTDTFVYDFSGVNFASPSTTDNYIINQLKKLKDGQSLPIMYVEVLGYCSYFPDNYTITEIVATGINNGFFIYADNTVVAMRYQRVCSATYTYKLLDGTTTINCGNKYAQELNHAQINSFNLTPTTLTKIGN